MDESRVLRARAEVELATRIGDRYEIVRELGAGQYAVTRLATDRASGRHCVVKSLPLHGVADAKVIELFEREARVLERLDHPRIPRFVELVRETTSEGTVLHLVQEYVEGETLEQAIERGSRFTEPEAKRVALELLTIVGYLHAFDPPLIHRDIKPSNIIVGTAGEIWLVDFGGVRDKLMLDVAEDSHGFTVVGTYGYMPYEQFEGNALPASDLYAIGVTLIFLLSHKEPADFDRRGMKIAFEGAINVSPAFEGIVGKLVEPGLDERYSAAADVRRDIERGESPGTRARRRRAAIIALAGVAALAGIVWIGSLAPGSGESRRLAEVRPETTSASAAKPGELAVPHATTTDVVWEVESRLGALPMPSAPVSVHGAALYDGRSVAEITSVRPQFWLRNETEGKVATARALYANGEFTIHGLAPGSYGMNLRFDAVAGNPIGYPGDLYAWRTFVVPESGAAELTVDLVRLIHLVSPQDNNVILEGWGEACDGKPSLEGDVAFAWEPVDRGVTYYWQVLRIVCPYGGQVEVARGVTEETAIRVPLEPSAPGEFYQFDLSAQKDGRRIGGLMTYGSFGHGWDYRFVVGRH